MELNYPEDFPHNLDSVLQVYGSNPLHKCVMFNHKMNLTFLLDHGLSPNQTHNCVTPLQVAILKNNVDCADILIKYGAKVNATSFDGGTPLCDACSFGNFSLVELLMKMGADVNPPLVLSTPLHEACFSGCSDSAALLVEAGAHLNANDCHYGTPLHAASLMNHIACARILLKAGAFVNAIKNHETALHIAVQNAYADLVKLLIEYGANIFASNNQNKLPIELLHPAEGPIYDLLVYCSSHPAGLKDLCRRKIRAILGSRITLIKDLNIPEDLCKYMMHL